MVETQVFGLSYEQALQYEPTMGEIPPIVPGSERLSTSPGKILGARAEWRTFFGKKPKNWKCWRSCQRGGS